MQTSTPEYELRRQRIDEENAIRRKDNGRSKQKSQRSSKTLDGHKEIIEGVDHSAPVIPRGESEQEAFMISAPGKLIVYGEHAVVYGKAAIAAAISLRSYLLVTPFDRSERILILAFPDVSLNHTWNIDALPWTTFAHPEKAKRCTDRLTKLDPELVGALEPYVSAVSPNAPDHIRKIHQSAAFAFLYILLSLGSSTFPPCIYTLRSTIPIASGLGSSASISVCISAAILHQIEYLKDPLAEDVHIDKEEAMEIVNQWAFVGELCIHGNPSGIDNTVATRGKAVYFKRSHSGEIPTVTPLHDFPALPLLLVDTKQSRSTAVEVAKVTELKERHPAIINPILDAIGSITESVLALITSPGFDTNNPRTLQVLGELTRVNHGLLVALGVSHPKLERIRELVDCAGVGWTKLTGAGGGGCAFTILKPGYQTETLQRLEQDLDAEGFARYATLLGANGVGLLKPAHVRGQEITYGKFLKAHGTKAVERLVCLGEATQTDWKFWASTRSKA